MMHQRDDESYADGVHPYLRQEATDREGYFGCAGEWKHNAAHKDMAAIPKRSPKVPLLIVANSPSEAVARDGLQRWKDKYREVANLLAVDDVLVDCMRGRSSV
jgi:hypothetical protein